MSNIYDSLNEYIKPEILDGQNQYRTDNYGNKKQLYVLYILELNDVITII